MTQMKSVIKTERLILRPWQQEDLELFAQLNSDARVMEYFPSTLKQNKKAIISLNVFLLS